MSHHAPCACDAHWQSAQRPSRRTQGVQQRRRLPVNGACDEDGSGVHTPKRSLMSRATSVCSSSARCFRRRMVLRFQTFDTARKRERSGYDWRRRSDCGWDNNGAMARYCSVRLGACCARKLGVIVLFACRLFSPFCATGSQPIDQHMPAEPPHQQGDECREEPNSLYSLLAPLVVETDKEVQNVAATQAELDKAVAHLTQRITFSLVAGECLSLKK